MKFILQLSILVFILFVSDNVNGQLPEYGVFPKGLVLESYQPSAEYSGNHIYDMGNWDIDSLLDAGQPVILDAFAIWCGPCWTYHQGGTLEDLYDEVGWGGEKKVAIFGVEADPSQKAKLLEGGSPSAGDWITNTKYPMVNNDEIADLINLKYFPTILLVCPDRTVVEVGQISKSDFLTVLTTCNGPASSTKDLRLIASSTPEKVAACKFDNIDLNASVVVQNYSTEQLTGSYTIEVAGASSDVIATTTVDLDLEPYAYQEVLIGLVNAIKGDNTFTAKITTENDDISNDEFDLSINVDVAPMVKVTDNKLTIELDIDDYGSDVGFALVQGVATLNASGAYSAASAENSLLYVANGSIKDGVTSYSEEVTLPELGCYYLVTNDSYEDGITYQNPNGEARIIAAETINISGDWGAGAIYPFEFIDETVSNDDLSEISSFSVFPNPANEVANVKFSVDTKSSVNIRLVNSLGQSVYSNNLGQVSGEQNIAIETNNLENGLYFIYIYVDGKESTRKMSIVK